MSDCGAPAAAACVRLLEGGDQGRFAQLRVHQIAQGAGSFPVYYAHSGYIFLKTCLKVIRQQLLHISRLEGVQVEHAVNRQVKWLGLIWINLPAAISSMY